MKHIFILNPRDSKTDIIKMTSDLCKICSINKLNYTIELAVNERDVYELAKLYASKTDDYTIYGVGDDNTLNTILNGIVPSSNKALGLIPSGNNSDFCRMLDNKPDTSNLGFYTPGYKVPKIKNNIEIINNIISGNIEEINYGKVNYRHFINEVSFGIEAEVVENARIMKKYKLVPDNMIHIASIIYTLYKFKNPNLKISFNDMTLEQEVTSLSICNGKYYQNGFLIAPEADYQDNLFDICMIDKINKSSIPFLLQSLKKGNHEKFPFVHTYKTDKIKLESNEYFFCNVDGEILVSNSFEIEMMKDKIKVLTQKKTTY